MIKTSELFIEKASIAWSELEKYEYPWQVLPHIKTFIYDLIEALPKDAYYEYEKDVWVANNAVIAKSASITGPCIIGQFTEVRHCAFIRGNAIIGDYAVVGNSTELKNVILFDNVQVPHYNYVGDSILGYKAHLGAGAITSNVKSDKKNIVIFDYTDRFETGMKKIGAILADEVEVGCSSVLNPGTIIGAYASVYPLSAVRGFIPQGSIYKNKNEIIERS